MSWATWSSLRWLHSRSTHRFSSYSPGTLVQQHVYYYVFIWPYQTILLIFILTASSWLRLLHKTCRSSFWLASSWLRLLCKTTFVHWSLIRQQIGIKFGSLIPACTQLRRSLQKFLGGLCTLQASHTQCPSFRSIFVCSWAWGKRSTLNSAPLFQSVHSSGKPGINFLAACAHCRPVVHDACLSDLFLSTAGHEVKDRH